MGDYDLETLVRLTKAYLTKTMKLYNEYLTLREALWRLCDSLEDEMRKQCFGQYHEQWLNSKIGDVKIRIELFYEYLRDEGIKAVKDEIERTRQLIASARLLYR